MTRQTRSGAQPESERVYTSSSKPKLQQAHFPNRRTTVRTYGRKQQRRAATSKLPEDEETFDPAPAEAEDSPTSQNTLTQMQWVAPSSSKLDATQSDMHRSSKKRRKTEGDMPDSSPESKGKKFKTQTLTQMPSFTGDEDPEEINGWRDDESIEVYSDPAIPVEANEPGSPSKPARSLPHTPSTKRVRMEIPSSQDSPITPMLARYNSPSLNRSPLKEKSRNTPSSSLKFSSPSKIARTPKRQRGLVIEDSTITASAQSPTSSVENHSPAKPRTPQAKSVRFATPRAGQPSQVLGERQPLGDITEEMEAAEEPDSSPSPLQRRAPLGREIADSDEEDEDWAASDQEETQDDEYGAVGEETQMLVQDVLSSSEKDVAPPVVSSGLAHSDTSHGDQSESSTVLPRIEPPSSVSEVPTVPLGTPPQRLTKGQPDVAETQSISEQLLSTTVQDFAPTQAKSQYATQTLDSQRISMDMIRAMAPQTDRSDIFISIHPDHVAKIVDGTKNHEFRNYKIPALVSRMWIYVTAPKSQLQYMACISNAKVPGEIQHQAGDGNAEFNSGNMMSAFAYELLEVYELNNPVSLQEMKDNGWVAGPPQKYNYVPPAVVGHLMANLRCSIYGDDEEQDEEQDEVGSNHAVFMASSPKSQVLPGSTPAPQVTVSQEVTNQLLSEATQHTSDPPSVVPSSQGAMEPSVNEKSPALPSSAAKHFDRALPPPPTPYSRPTAPTPSRAIRPSQATTVSQLSSPSQSPVKSTSRPLNHNSSSDLTMLQGVSTEDSPMPPPSSNFQMGSSQLLTKSQMLPESLIGEEEEALGIIYDSQGEDAE